ncbi:MAG: DUF3500 domain-containing protein [Planctomycetes bacterium]|nr:DUF3500 domain-containing protein [Planctomycetota bacterium]
MHAPLAFSITGLMACAGGLALWPDRPPPPAREVEQVAVAVRAFLDALAPEQLAKAQRGLDDAERTSWHFVPGRYAGIELGALDARQRDHVHDVLSSFLSVAGHGKARAIMALENVLHELESSPGHDAAHRDPDRYAMLVLGEPAAAGSFVVRFQGHHISLQLVVHDGKVAGHTPQFLGTNPHELRDGKQHGHRVLGAEEDLARALLLLLDDEQLAKAVIDDEAPKDVLLGPGQPPSALGARRGLPWRQMDATQRGVLWRLIEEYARIWRGEFAAAELLRIREHGLDELSFAWAGGRERGQGHYYRIHGAHFAIEYDNTQNGANHVHTVWRDFEQDHGGDPLRRHLDEQHGK